MFQLVLSWGCVLDEIVIVLLYRFISTGNSTWDDIYIRFDVIFPKLVSEARLLLEAFAFFFFFVSINKEANITSSWVRESMAMNSIHPYLFVHQHLSVYLYVY